jgi:nitrilase
MGCVADTQFGRIGTLICGENTNALARYSLIAQAEQVRDSHSVHRARALRS